MDLLSVIRRWHGRDKLSIREISRRTGLSRHTIRKYLASGIVEPKYPLRRSVSKLDPFAGTLSTWLKRVFDIDIENCSECGGDIRIIACIEDPEVIRKILAHVDEKVNSTGADLLPESRAPPATGLFA